MDHDLKYAIDEYQEGLEDDRPEHFSITSDITSKS